MKHLIRLTDWTVADLREVTTRAGWYRRGSTAPILGCAVLIFPPTSLRTRVSFERGAHLMGLQPISFPQQVLETAEDPADVVGYLSQWASVIVARYPNIEVLERLAAPGAVPIVNAMTDVNHPCEVLTTLVGLSADGDPRRLRVLLVAADGNIARAWAEAALAFGLDVTQCCPADLATQAAAMAWTDDLLGSAARADVIVTDGPGAGHAAAMAPFQVTVDVLKHAPDDVTLAPCPPFVRGREVSGEAIASPAFVGYEFLKDLVPVQQAIMSLLVDQR